VTGARSSSKGAAHASTIRRQSVLVHPWRSRLRGACSRLR
jgi:hypothetical protein